MTEDQFMSEVCQGIIMLASHRSSWLNGRTAPTRMWSEKLLCKKVSTTRRLGRGGGGGSEVVVMLSTPMSLFPHQPFAPFFIHSLMMWSHSGSDKKIEKRKKMFISNFIFKWKCCWWCEDPLLPRSQFKSIKLRALIVSPPINICKAFICFCRSAEEEAAAWINHE